MKQKATIIGSLLLSAALIYAAIFGLKPPQGGGSDAETPSAAQETVAIEDGRQIVNITAKGGYSPRNVTAQAGIPTVLRVTTKGTFDCSSAFTIPSRNIAKMLPAKGTTDFDLGTPVAGEEVQALCSMGMYSMKIRFI